MPRKPSPPPSAAPVWRQIARPVIAVDPALPWRALHVAPLAERAVEDEAGRAGVIAWSPITAWSVLSRGRVSRRWRAAMPGYVFVVAGRVDFGRIRGVLAVLGEVDGGQLVRIEAALAAGPAARDEAAELIGRVLRIAGGPCAGRLAEVTERAGAGRVRARLVGYGMRVELPVADLQAA